MRTPIILAFALAAMPALAQPRLEAPVTITAIEAMPTPLCFFFFCGLSLGTVPDGAGGFVPFTNSRVMPDGSLRPYDPAIDGMPGVVPDGPYPALAPMPEPPTAYYDPPPRLFTMLRGAVLPRCLGSGTIQTRRPRRYPKPASGWNRNEWTSPSTLPSGMRGRSERGATRRSL